MHENTVSASPHDTYILYSIDVPLSNQTFYFEGDAQRAAELVARSCKGARVSVAKIIASVVEPLTPLQWTDGREAGNGLRNSPPVGTSPMMPAGAYDPGAAKMVSPQRY